MTLLTTLKTSNFFFFLIRKKEKPYKKFKKFKSNEQKSNKKEKEVRCFKCGQKGHIAPNCKNKVNVLSDNEEEYYSENNTSSSETDKSQIDPEKEIEKIENCLCQVNMLTTEHKKFNKTKSFTMELCSFLCPKSF